MWAILAGSSYDPLGNMSGLLPLTIWCYISGSTKYLTQSFLSIDLPILSSILSSSSFCFFISSFYYLCKASIGLGSWILIPNGFSKGSGLILFYHLYLLSGTYTSSLKLKLLTGLYGSVTGSYLANFTFKVGQSSILKVVVNTP